MQTAESYNANAQYECLDKVLDAFEAAQRELHNAIMESVWGSDDESLLVSVSEEITEQSKRVSELMKEVEAR